MTAFDVTLAHATEREARDSAPWAAEARALFALALPLILANLAQSAIHATDLVFLGRLGPDAVGAASLAINLYVPFLLAGMGLITAVSPLVAAERGRRRHSVREVRRTVRQGLWLGVIACVPCWLVLWHGEAILLAMRQPPDLARDAGAFLRVLQWGLLPSFLYFGLRNFIASIERPVWGTVVLFGAVGINALLGWALIFGNWGAPRLGFEGAALASALSNLFLFVSLALVVAFAKPFRRYAIFGRWWRADWTRMRELVRVGLPIAVTITMEVGVFSGAVFLMGLIGKASIAAHAVALQIAAASFMVPMGLAQAATVRVGLGFGARDAVAVGRSGWTAIVMATGFMALMALVLVVFPRPLIGIFLDTAAPANAEVVALAVGFLVAAAIFQVFDGVQVVALGALRGVQDTTWPMVFAGVGYWVVGIGVGALLAFWAGFEGLGVWLGLASGLAFVAVLLLIRWTRREALGLVPDSA